MKVFADTNFLVSSFATKGLSTDVFQTILADHHLITGEFVLDELKRVLDEKLDLPTRLIAETEELLRRHTVVPLPQAPSEIDVRDEDDRWVLESAIQAKAEVLITGDKDLLVINDNVGNMEIVTPRGFWELLRKEERS